MRIKSVSYTHLEVYKRQVYGFVASALSFVVVHFWFKNPDNTVLTVLFYASLFLIGLQFAAVTLMPMIMTAD